MFSYWSQIYKNVKQKEELKTRQANIEELAVNNRETAKDEDDLRPDKNIGKGRFSIKNVK